MKSRNKRLIALSSTATGLLLLRMGLPAILTWLANIALHRVPGVRGRIRRVRFDFITPRVMVHGLQLATSNGGKPQHSLAVSSIVIGSNWANLLRGAWIGYIRVDSPNVLLNLDRDAGRTNGQSIPVSKGPSDERAPKQLTWQERIKQLPAFKISSAALTNGEIHITGLAGQDGTDFGISRIELSATNITNSAKLAASLMATVSCHALVSPSGQLAFRVEGYPIAEQATFDADLQVSNIDLTGFSSLLEHKAEIGVRRGTAALYVEAAAVDNYVEGYAKPVFDHLELKAPAAKSGFMAKVKIWAAKTAVKLGRNKRYDRVATRLDFQGSLNDPGLNLTDAVVKFFRNSFGVAERASLDRRIWFYRAGKTENEVEVHVGMEGSSRTAAGLRLLKETASKWSGDSAPRMAAALAYYTAFSMAPLLIVAIAIAGLVLGREAAQGKIVEQIGGLVGRQSASAIQGMIAGAHRPAKGVVASIIGIVTLMAGAVGVLSELKSALNTIWRTQEHSDVKEIVKKNVLFLGMLLGIGFLLTISLVVSAGVAGLGTFLSGLLPAPELLIQTVNFILSIGVVAVLFAAMYRFLPNTRVEWHDVWVGALVTSLLFEIGKLGLGLYIGKSTVGSSYGAAGSILVLLLWVYYSGLIFYFGAEFTKVYADHYGSRTRRGKVHRPTPPVPGFGR